MGTDAGRLVTFDVRAHTRVCVVRVCVSCERDGGTGADAATAFASRGCYLLTAVHRYAIEPRMRSSCAFVEIVLVGT